MATEHVPVPARASDRATPTTRSTHVRAVEVGPTTGDGPGSMPARTPAWASPVAERPGTPVNEGLIELASGLAPGKALDLGCGEGQNAMWLARQGWIVRGVDLSAGAIASAREQAATAGVERAVSFEVADLARWTPVSRYDLVLSTFALPARGMGRSRVLEMAAAAVAPGGTILITELDASLRREGWMAEKYLVSVEEIERHLGGFRIDRSGVERARHRHGYEERVLPVASVVATRRTDLRSAW